MQYNNKFILPTLNTSKLLNNISLLIIGAFPFLHIFKYKQNSNIAKYASDKSFEEKSHRYNLKEERKRKEQPWGFPQAKHRDQSGKRRCSSRRGRWRSNRRRSE